MQTQVVWQSGMHFEGSTENTFRLPLDASTAVGGNNQGFRPLELLLLGLAGCTGMDVLSILQKKRQEISAFEVRVSANQREEHPRIFSEVHVEYVIRGHAVEVAAVERAIELSVTKYCPAQAMLGQAVLISHTYSIQEV